MECLAELLRSPPISTTPWGDTQLECSVLWSVRVWEGSQDPAEKLKQPLVKASLPPHPVDHVGQLAPGAAVTAQNLRRLEPVVPGDVSVPAPARHQDSCSNMEEGGW